MTRAPVWPLDRPPCDSAAEAAVLWMLMLTPDTMNAVSLGDQLHMPEHQHIWQAMVRTRLRNPAAQTGPWWRAIRFELHEMLCDDASVAEHQEDGDWTWRCYGWRTWRALRPPDDWLVPHALDYWLGRLDRAADARRLIAAAQRQAERAWRGDVDGARDAALATSSGRLIPIARSPIDARPVPVLVHASVNVADLDM